MLFLNLYTGGAQYFRDDFFGFVEVDRGSLFLKICEDNVNRLSISTYSLDDLLIIQADFPGREVDFALRCLPQSWEVPLAIRRLGLPSLALVVVNFLVPDFIALDTLEGLHPFVHVDDAVTTDVNEVEDVLNYRETWYRIPRQLTQSDDEFIKLIERHFPRVICIKLEIIRHYAIRAVGISDRFTWRNASLGVSKYEYMLSFIVRSFWMLR